MGRIGLWETWLAEHRPLGSRRILILLSATGAVLLIAFLDPITSLSLAILCLFPVLVVTLTVSGTAGVAISAIGALAAAVAASSRAHHGDLDTLSGQALVQFASLLAAVAVVAGLRASMAEARASDRRAREFLRYLAHQLRTPVAGIRSNAEALIISGEPPGREQLLAGLVTESERIGRIMASLLRMARIDHGEPFDVEALDVVGLCAAEVERARSRVGHRLELDLETGLAPRGEVMLSGEATREALTNLLENAVRFASRRVVVVISDRERSVEIVVSDDGPGLPVGQEERAFERFVTLGNGGAGLGLPIARALCEAQGGRLLYDEGRFVMRLPQKRARTRS